MMHPDQFIQVNGIKTRYWQVGDRGTPLLLLHGIGVAVEWFSENIATLAQRHRVYAVDLPGHGQTGPITAPYTLESYANFVRHFMDAVGLERSAVLGHSLGGGVALWLTLANPQRVSKLILLSSAMLGKEIAFPFRLMTLPWIGEQMAKPSESGNQQMLKLIFHDPAKAPSHFPAIMLRYGKQPATQAAVVSTVRSGLNFWGVRPSLLAHSLGGLNANLPPTLILWGKQDALFPVRHAEEAQRRLPTIRLHLFDACGHNPQVEQIDEFHHQVLQFLQEA